MIRLGISRGIWDRSEGASDAMSSVPTIVKSWSDVQQLTPKHYTCGHCGEQLSSEKGYTFNSQRGQAIGGIYICHHCGKPTYFDPDSTQVPGSLYGSDITGIDDQAVSDLYNEARRCVSVNAFTATVLSCRKLLMHIAVANGAQENLAFIKYVEYLSDNHYVPPGAKSWVDHIRAKGNEANHDIVIMHADDAKDLIDFIAMLLTNIYEFPARIRKRTQP
jgi:hypothetical protein